MNIQKLYNNMNIPTCSKTHRLLCLQNLNKIKTETIPEIKKYNLYESVLIEFRILPHTEYLLRNAILKFPNWSHTIICGNLNYNFYKNMIDNISPNINLIKLNFDNIHVSVYNELLLTIDFWKLFYGEKLLIYQEDTFIFHNKIDEFLIFDYIGAPWKYKKYKVGNGGFSLRTKDVMIKCLENKQKINNILNLKNINYILKNIYNEYIIREDIFFSAMIHNYKYGLIPQLDIAIKFSQESIISKNPLGGHKFYNVKNPKLSINYK